MWRRFVATQMFFLLLFGFSFSLVMFTHEHYTRGAIVLISALLLTSAYGFWRRRKIKIPNDGLIIYLPTGETWLLEAGHIAKCHIMGALSPKAKERLTPRVVLHNGKAGSVVGAPPTRAVLWAVIQALKKWTAVVPVFEHVSQETQAYLLEKPATEV